MHAAREQGAAASVETRLARLEACEAIRACVYAYAVAGDRGNRTEILREVFTDNGVYEAAGMGRFEGLPAILTGLAEIANNVVLWSFHAPGGPLIRLGDDGKRATVFWWVWCPVVLRSPDGATTPHWGAGHYNGELADERGRWKFTRLFFETRLRTPFAGPWSVVDNPFQWPL
jgi:hypothetical protein